MGNVSYIYLTSGDTRTEMGTLRDLESINEEEEKEELCYVLKHTISHRHRSQRQS